MTDELDLDEVTSTFGEVYLSVKGTKKTDGWEKLLKDAQVEFFSAATEYWKGQTLARKTVEYPPSVADEMLFDDWLVLYHPGWRLVDMHMDEPLAILEEDPALKKFAYVNKLDGKVYRRGQTNGPAQLDVDRLLHEDRELFMDLTEWPADVLALAREALLWAYTSVHNPDPQVVVEAKIDEFMATQDPEVRVFKGESEWTIEQSDRVKEYLTPGKITVRLTPPRDAKDSELETGEVEDE